MQTANKLSTRPSASPAKSRTATALPHAIRLLEADHAEVSRCFKEYQKLVKRKAGANERESLAQHICALLTAHATIEEEIFYPAARVVLDDEALVDEADVEHACAKDLIAQIEGMTAGDPLYDAKVKVLGEYIAHHVAEEQDELFPKLREAGLDARTVGEELADRKAELMRAIA